MAKTIDDLIVEISDLVKVLNKQNSNSGGRSGHNSFALTGDVFKSFASEIASLAETAKQLSEAQSTFANTIAKKGTQEWQDYIEEIRNNIKSSAAAMEEFRNTIHQKNHPIDKELNDYIKRVAELKLEEASIQDEINAKRIFLLETEQKLINDKLKIEEAELAAKQKYAKEIEESSKRAAEAAEAFADTKIVLETLQQDIESIKEEVRNARSEEVEETANIQKSNAGKQENINITHENAMAKKEEKRLEGYNKKGQKKSIAEWKELIGNFEEKWNEASTGRKVGMVANVAAQGASSATKKIQSGKMDVSGMADTASNALMASGNPYAMAAGAVMQVLKSVFEMFAGVDKAASDYARSVGGGHRAHVKMRRSAADLTAEMSKFGKTVYESEKLLERMSEASEAMGRNLEGLSTKDLRSLIDLKNFGIDDQTISQFDTFGISVHNVSKQIKDLYSESGKKGLNAKATIKAFTSNLKMAQNYTFARGQKALMDMAMKSAQLKFNLRDAEQFANKVSTLEGAMQAGAQLSVLGGNFAMQGNPLAMMYNGLNDVEGLQNQMLAMTKGMARWDSQKGQLDITAFDRERLKAMSQATGIDYSSLTSQALNQARVDRVSAQLGGGFKKEEEEYIKNLASLDEHGNAYIQVGGKEYSMDDIRQNKDGVRNQLKAESEAKDTKENADMGDIWGETRGIQDKLDDFIKFFKGRFTQMIMRIAGIKDHEKFAEANGIDTNDKEAMSKLRNAKNKEKAGVYVNEMFGDLKNDWWKFLGPQIYYHVGSSLYKAITHDASGAMDKVAKENKMGGYSEQKKASGGFVSGDGGPTEDAIPARLSNGEFVVNAEATTRHRSLLERINRGIRNGSNLMRAESIMGLGSGELRRGSGNQKIDVSPIKIEFGTLELKIGDLSRVLDSNEVASRLLNNSAFVDNIVKEIGIRSNFGYRKDDSSNKFLDSPYTRSF